MKINKKLYLQFLPLIIHIIISIFLILTILQFKGIENIIRYIGIIFLVFLNGFVIYKVINIIKIKDKGKMIIIYLCLILSILIQYSINSLIDKAYDTLKKLNGNETEYSSSLVVLKDSDIKKVDDVKNKKIGILNDEENIEGYLIPKQIIKDNKLENNTLVKYENPLSLINDLYDGVLDGIFISTNYALMYTSNIEKYQNINQETRIILSKKKKYIKKEISSTKKVTEPFTLLIMGVDSEKEDIHSNNTFNGDALMLLTFNPNTLNATILSIPRDTYVPIACFNNKIENKITHAAWQGESCMIETINNFTGINIDYYIKINFKGVVNLVDTIGGIKVDVPINFCEQNSDRQFGKNEICLRKKEQVLNGEQALALSRHRKTINDIERGLNQQLVIDGILNQLKNISNIDQVYKLLDTLEKNVDTNLSINQILSFYNIGKDIIKTSKYISNNVINIRRLYLSGYDSMIYDEGMGLTLYNYIYYKNSLNECVTAMKQNLGLESIVPNKSFNFSINKPYEIPTIGKVNSSNDEIIKVVPNFEINSKNYALNWGNKNSITINFKTIDSYDNNYSQDQIISQSVPYGYRLSNLKNKSITLKVINIIENPDIIPEEDKIDCNGYDNDPVCFVPDMNNWTLADIKKWQQSLPQYNISIIINIDEKEAINDEEKEAIGKVFEKDVTTGTLLNSIEEINIIYIKE